jgi:predicted ATP-grasp superfamily ATP-dependent carboligase
MTPAVVLGPSTNGLGVIRSLGRANVPVFVVGDTWLEPAMHSRYARTIRVRSLDASELVDVLMDVSQRLGGQRAMIFPTSDVQVLSISEHRHVLDRAFHIPLPPHRLVCDLMHKGSFHRLAQSHGFPVPRSLWVRTAEDTAALEGLRYPVIIKPTLHQYCTGWDTPRNTRAASAAEASRLCRQLLAAAPDLVVQEWIDGEDSDIYFCLQYRDAGGRRVRSFTGRKLQSWPPQTGSTASCAPAPEAAAELEALTSAFFDAVGFHGTGSMEFKRDGRDGRFLMIEPTIGRTDHQEEIATLNGVNIPCAAYCDRLGLPISVETQPPAPVVWRDTLYYWEAEMTGAARRRVSSSPARRSVVKGVFWRGDDPMPSLFFLLRWLRKAPTASAWRSILAQIKARATRRARPTLSPNC